MSCKCSSCGRLYATERESCPWCERSPAKTAASGVERALPATIQTPVHTPGAPFPNLSSQAVKVKTTFDVFAWLTVIVGALVGLGLLIAAASASGDYYTEGLGGPYVLASLAVAAYTALAWAGLKLSAVVAGYIANKSAL